MDCLLGWLYRSHPSSLSYPTKSHSCFEGQPLESAKRERETESQSESVCAWVPLNVGDSVSIRGRAHLLTTAGACHYCLVSGWDGLNIQMFKGPATNNSPFRISHSFGYWSG